MNIELEHVFILHFNFYTFLFENTHYSENDKAKLICFPVPQPLGPY